MGLGFVGSATKDVLSEHHEVFGYDPAIEGYKDLSVLEKAQVIFLCVPTPPKDSGEIDLSYIQGALESIKGLGTNPVVCIKSTIIPGTSDELEATYNIRIVHNPEFLREKYALEDFENSDRVILGGENDSREIIKVAYLPIFPEEKIKYVMLTNKQAEMVKYITNIFLSTQVSFANEMWNICNLLGIDYDEIEKVINMDDRLGRHINVPGPDGKLGFGGKCLPKELKAMIYHVRERGYIPTLLQESWRFNQTQRK